jgi:SPASM domain peptide maturase of grasp-with-spasm system
MVRITANKNYMERAMKRLKFHADCKIVEGASNFAIYDLTRRKVFVAKMELLPKIKRFEELDEKTANEYIASSDDPCESQAVFDFLLSNELASFQYRSGHFVELSESIHMRGVPVNAIIDVRDLRHDFKRIAIQLESIDCEFIQVRIFSEICPIDLIQDVCSAFVGKTCGSIEFVFTHFDFTKQEEVSRFISKNGIVSRVVVLGSVKSFQDGKIQYSREQVAGACDCGKIGRRNLSLPSTSAYLKMKNVNGCLASKIAIDERGRVKNCPSLTKEYGAVENADFSEIFTSSVFKVIGNVSKDGINGCRDCEYRYCCSDCRAFLSDESDPMSKPGKCLYDPYTGNWQEHEV